MKQILQIIGAEIIQGGTGQELNGKVKIICIPFTTEQVKLKKPSLMQLASGGGGIQEIIQQAQDMQKHKTTFIVSLDEWLHEYKNKILTKIEIDIKCTQYYEE